MYDFVLSHAASLILAFFSNTIEVRVSENSIYLIKNWYLFIYLFQNFSVYCSANFTYLIRNVNIISHLYDQNVICSLHQLRSK